VGDYHCKGKQRASIFGDIGLKPEKDGVADTGDMVEYAGQSNRIMMWGIIGVVLATIIYFLTSSGDGQSILNVINKRYMPALLFGSVISIVGFIVTDPTLTKVEKDRVWVIVVLTFFTVFFWWAFEQSGGSMTIFSRDYTDRTLVGAGAAIFNSVNTLLTVGSMAVITWVLMKLFNVTWSRISLANSILAVSFIIIWIIVILMLGFEWGYFEGIANSLGLTLEDKTEVQASWFSILNSFFIITLAPAFSKFWDKKIITSGPVKFGIGLILVGIGFALLALGSNGIPQGAKTASVSMIWLVLAYFFHTAGELCVSPVGLSYVSKLAPVRLIGLMFGVWFIANFIANWSAGMTGSYIDAIVEANSMSGFFLIFTGITVGAGIICILLKGILGRMMHGFE